MSAPTAAHWPIADVPHPAIPYPTQTLQQVHYDPLNLPGPLVLAAGDPLRRNRPVKPPLTSDLGQGLDCKGLQSFQGSFCTKTIALFYFM